MVRANRSAHAAARSGGNTLSRGSPTAGAVPYVLRKCFATVAFQVSSRPSWSTDMIRSVVLSIRASSWAWLRCRACSDALSWRVMSMARRWALRAIRGLGQEHPAGQAGGEESQQAHHQRLQPRVETAQAGWGGDPHRPGAPEDGQLFHGRRHRPGQPAPAGGVRGRLAEQGGAGPRHPPRGSGCAPAAARPGRPGSSGWCGRSG